MVSPALCSCNWLSCTMYFIVYVISSGFHTLYSILCTMNCFHPVSKVLQQLPCLLVQTAIKLLNWHLQLTLCQSLEGLCPLPSAAIPPFCGLLPDGAEAAGGQMVGTASSLYLKTAVLFSSKLGCSVSPCPAKCGWVQEPMARAAGRSQGGRGFEAPTTTTDHSGKATNMCNAARQTKQCY